MVPIGIVTRNRVAYLDATLRSLSATELPQDVALRVYDDNSDDLAARQYLYESDRVDCPRNWPAGNRAWKKAGLSCVSDADLAPQGIHNKVVVHNLGQSGGVFAASCRSVVRLFDEFPAAEGVFLLQDDIVLKPDWYARMLAARDHRLSRPTGLLAGIRLNRKIRGHSGPVIESAATAQCLYLPRITYERLGDWFRAVHRERRQFDDKLCSIVARSGLAIGLVMPFVCQHLGVVSAVRPTRTWHRSPSGGRIGYYVGPPYAYAATVRPFP